MNKIICKIIGHKRKEGVYEDIPLPYCSKCNTDLPLKNNNMQEETTCGKPHNNGDDESQCAECMIIKLNI